MTFGPILGVNHHINTVFLGCALIFNETTETFISLFENWLEAMGGTNQVFKKCIAAYTVQQFQVDWLAMIQKYDLQEESWLKLLYGCRTQWIDVYIADRFTAGMKTTQQSEGFNHHLKIYFTSGTSLQKFMNAIEKLQNKKFIKEKEKDSKDLTSTHILNTTFLIEEHAAKTYIQKLVLKNDDVFEKVKLGFSKLAEEVNATRESLSNTHAPSASTRCSAAEDK
ncbi:protein FAR1-RELATED SEQUENCE 5-like, partial [Amborella trichopoda]|uniref:protein FAR1-RELATED SEQUENCE 5-like n=1 Tax=Amborella trichopoda TaxID=13333 RepID=UPI0005D32BBE